MPCINRLNPFRRLFTRAVFLAVSQLSVANAADATDSTIIYGDVVAAYNPLGAMVFVGATKRHVFSYSREYNAPFSYLQGGAAYGINPAYGQLRAHVEWMPAIFAQLRVQADRFNYFGRYTGLLSFSKADADYGDSVQEARKDDVEKASAYRLMVQPTLRAKIGWFFLRNQADIAQYYFDAGGRYVLEPEFDILMAKDDMLIANRSYVMMDFSTGRASTALFVGPYFEYIGARDSGDVRRRLGAAVYWEPALKMFSIRQYRVYAQMGLNLEDRNRDNQVFAQLGVGFEMNLF